MLLNTTMLIKSQQISIKKIYHRGNVQIGIFFSYNEETIRQIKSIPTARYSNTKKCWYIPYTKEAYHAFKSLSLRYEIDRTTNTHSRTRPTPKKSELSAKKNPDPIKESRKLDTDINPLVRGLQSIVLQDQVFHIKISYSKEEISYLKALYGTYWNKEQRSWICRATPSNCEKLQTRYRYWSNEKLIQIQSFMNKPKSKVHISAISDDDTKLKVKIIYASKAVEWVKQISGRVYNKSLGIWYIPRNKNTVDRLIEKCTAAGYPIKQQLSWETVMPIGKSRNSQQWLSAVLSGVCVEQMEIMEKYAKTFIRENYSFRTMKVYCGAFRSFLYSLDDITKINELPQGQIQDYLNKVLERGVSYNELNRHISAIKFYFEKLGGWNTFDLSSIKRPRRPKSLPNIFSIGEVQRLFDEIKNEKHRCMLFLAYGCGLRAGEVVTIQLRDLRVDRGQIFIRGGKGKKDRVVMFPKMLLPVLGDYLKIHTPDRWLFPGQDRRKPYSLSSLRKVFKRGLAKAGLDKSHKLHNLRHSFATHLMERGTQQRLIQQLLGHSSSKTTEIYTQVSRGMISQVVSPLDDLSENIVKNGTNYV